eukprot:TRINITY_DN17211_c0_g1_i2.p1 TRINITY_DN17211_c0_g1~~TRINITY_DN17211_c0_g1_i2.p1  ORF type:complete len:481 (+),score=85.15 TRINITY_DN17211_c0_g1_i2:44-1444(+)
MTMKGVSSVDQRYDASAVRDLMRRYGLPSKIITDLYMKGVGRRHFMEGDFMEYGPLFGEKLRRLQEKWRVSSDNFLHDRPPSSQRVIQKLSAFYTRHGMPERARTVPGLVDSFTDDPEALQKLLTRKFSSLEHEFAPFLQTWVRDMKRYQQKLTLYTTQLDHFFEVHGDDTTRYVPFLLSPSRDIISAFSDDPKALFDLLTGDDNNRPSVIMDLSWLLNWSDEVETGYGEALLAKDEYREQEDGKMAKLEMRQIRREIRETENRCLDEAENEAERRQRILQLEHENEDIRKQLRKESTKRTVTASTHVTESDLSAVPEEEQDTEEVRQYYRQQARVISILQEKLRNKKRTADSLRRQLFEKQKSAFSNVLATDINNYQTSTLYEQVSVSPPGGLDRFSQTPDIDDLLSPPPLVYETPQKRTTSRVPHPDARSLPVAPPPFTSSQFGPPLLSSPGGASGWFLPPGKL